VCRQGGTERAFTGALLDEKHPGVFVCQSCGHELFRSEHKFKSGTGWPSFSDVAAQGAVRSIRDSSLGMVRTEVRCGRCDAHLGHVFEDGPPPTDLRYCINSVCMLHVPVAPVTDGTNDEGRELGTEPDPTAAREADAAPVLSDGCDLRGVTADVSPPRRVGSHDRGIGGACRRRPAPQRAAVGAESLNPRRRNEPLDLRGTPDNQRYPRRRPAASPGQSDDA
jgi:peptide-methionine (R)-S-oxide reductase